MNLSDGSHVEIELLPAYRRATQRFWSRFPEFSIAGYSIILTEPAKLRPVAIARDVYRALRQIRDFITQAKKPSLSTRTCDALLFYHGDKPNVRPPIEWLARRLVENDKTCFVISGDNNATLWIPGPTPNDDIQLDNVDGFESWIRNGGTRRNAIWLLVRSMIAFVLLLGLLLKKRQAWTIVNSNPFAVWYHLLVGARRSQVADEILAVMQPKLLLVTNERAPLAAGLLGSKHSRRARTVQLYSELFTQGFHPILSSEVWTWNETVINAVRTGESVPPHVEFKVVGNAELNIALHNRQLHKNATSDLERSTEGHPVFLFLVDYDQSNVRNTEQIAAEAHRWIADAAGRHPEWYFILKTRPNHHDIELPSQDVLFNLDNVIISRGDIEFGDFLTWDNLNVVGGYSSTGLFVAAGTGRTTCRFVLSDQQANAPIIDEVTTAVSSGSDLSKLLQMSLDDTEKDDDPTVDDQSKFPYREETLKQIEKHCLGILESAR
jgi:hypothetical protein